jgi:hypothetical protein
MLFQNEGVYITFNSMILMDKKMILIAFLIQKN